MSLQEVAVNTDIRACSVTHECGECVLPNTLLSEFTSIAVTLVIEGKSILAAVPEATLGKSRSEQNAIAAHVRGRLATSHENRLVAAYVINRWERGQFSQDEVLLLEAYRTKYVRDEEGGLYGGGRHIYRRTIDMDDDEPRRGALIICPNE